MHSACARMNAQGLPELPVILSGRLMGFVKWLNVWDAVYWNVLIARSILVN